MVEQLCGVGVKLIEMITSPPPKKKERLLDAPFFII